MKKAFFFIENTFSFIQHILTTVSLPSLLPAPPSPSQIHSPSIFVFRKRTGLQETTAKRTKQGRIRKEKPSYRAWTRKLKRRKRALRGGKWVGEIPVPTVRSPTKTTKLIAIKYTWRTWCRPMQAPFLPLQSHMSPSETCLVDSVGHFLLVFSIPSESYTLSSLSSKEGFPDHQREGPNGALQFRFSICVVFGCGSYLLLQQASLMVTGQGTNLWSYEDSRLSLVIISLFFFFFPVVLGSTLGAGPGHPGSVEHGLSHDMRLK